MANILDRIIEKKRKELSAATADLPLNELEQMIPDLPPPLDFLGALRKSHSVSLIAEVKKASPSKGVIRDDFDPIAIAQIYMRSGASCISVLTDEHFFQGRLEYLKQIRTVVDIPLLRKDFIIDPYQVTEARISGADAVLLIAECLDDFLLKELHDQIIELGMTPLVEFYDAENLERVVAIGAKLIGINNRNLRNFETDLQHCVRMRKRLPEDVVVVGESGIFEAADVQILKDASIDAMLVGESLMRQNDIGAAVQNLLKNNGN